MVFVPPPPKLDLPNVGLEREGYHPFGIHLKERAFTGVTYEISLNQGVLVSVQCAKKSYLVDWRL